MIDTCPTIVNGVVDISSPIGRAILRLRLHRSTLQPSVPFIYLALTALDMERLRAALIGRALFADQEEALEAAVGGVPA